MTIDKIVLTHQSESTENILFIFAVESSFCVCEFSWWLLKCFADDVSWCFWTNFPSQTSRQLLDSEQRSEFVCELCHGWFSLPYKCEFTCDSAKTICYKTYRVLAEFLHKNPLNTRVGWWIINDKKKGFLAAATAKSMSMIIIFKTLLMIAILCFSVAHIHLFKLFKCSLGSQEVKTTQKEFENCLRWIDTERREKMLSARIMTEIAWRWNCS